MRKFIWLILFSFFSSNMSYAQVFYCPNKGSYINLGDTLAQVIAACGEPSSKKSGDVAKTQTSNIEQWFYSLGSNRQGNLRIKVTFTIKNGKVSEILIDNQQVQSVSLCNSAGEGSASDLSDIGNVETANTGTPVSVGDPAGSVETFCGEPNFINRTTQTEQVGTNKAEIWNYNFGPYQPQVELQFTNGKLTSIKQK